jgi:hypothetical protein
MQPATLLQVWDIAMFCIHERIANPEDIPILRVGGKIYEGSLLSERSRTLIRAVMSDIFP